MQPPVYKTLEKSKQAIKRLVSEVQLNSNYFEERNKHSFSKGSSNRQAIARLELFMIK